MIKLNESVKIQLNLLIPNFDMRSKEIQLSKLV